MAGCARRARSDKADRRKGCRNCFTHEIQQNCQLVEREPARRFKPQTTQRVSCCTVMLLAWRRNAATGCEASGEIRGSSPGECLHSQKDGPGFHRARSPLYFVPQATAGTNKERQFKKHRPIGSREELPGEVSEGEQPSASPPLARLEICLLEYAS